MSMHFRDLAEKAAHDGAISAEEILALRRAGWANGTITPDEAEALFMANDKLDAPTSEWSDFFVAAVGEFVVNGLEPKGYVTDGNGDWLMEKISHNGKTDSLTELELLVRVFERAQNVPQSLREYALAQVERAVISGTGPTRCGGQLEAGNVTEAEARLMRRIIFSTASERPAAVSRKEAELLYHIKDQTLGRDNAPEWKRLFVQGVGNYLAGFSSHTPLSRERAIELESFMDDHRASIGGMFARIGKAAVKENFFNSIGEAFSRKDDGPDTFQQAEDARKVDAGEHTWLEGRLDGNGQIDEYDEALLAFLEEESDFNTGR